MSEIFQSKHNAEQIEALLDRLHDNNLDNYSTEEQRIGTWINGKHIYRKVCNTSDEIKNADIIFQDQEVDNKHIIVYTKSENFSK